jgi:hypothetical protein
MRRLSAKVGSGAMSQPSRIRDANPDGSEWLTLRLFLLVLAAALVAAFPRVALGLDTFFCRDFGALGYPGVIFLRDSLARGELPLWDPYSHCGVPYLAQMGQWYPPTWLCCFLPLPWAVNFLMLAHLWFGGFGVFWLLHRWRVGNYAAAFGGFAFVFNGVMLSCLLWGNYIASLALLPWVAGSVIEAWRSGGRWLPLAAIASAMQVLTATPELTLLTWLLLGALWLGEALSGRTQFARSLCRLVAVVLLAAGITMVQMLPFFDLMAHSQRSAGGVDTATWSMPGWGWASFLVPLFHSYPSPQGQWFQHDQEFLASYYLGAGVLALAAVGAWCARTRTATIMAGLILFCWIMALGPNGGVFEPLKKVLPLISVARYPVKFVILTAFLVPLLAAFGLERLQHPRESRPRRVLSIIIALFLALMAGLVWFECRYPLPSDDWTATAASAAERALLMLAMAAGVLGLRKLGDRHARVFLQVALLALLPLDALTHSPKIAPTLPAFVLNPGVWQVSGRPAPRLGEGRIMINPNAEQKLLYSQVADMQADFIGKRAAEWYNLNLLDGVPKVTGAITLRPASFDILERYLYYTPDAQCGRGLVDFLSVEWLTAPDNPAGWTGRPGSLPWITAGQQPVFADDAGALRGIMALDFAPEKIVYLPESSRASVTITNQTRCALSHGRMSLNAVAVDADADAPSLIVLSQSYYHLWRVFVDGQPVQLLRANLAFQAVAVAAGRHHVDLVYRDPRLEMGAGLSLLALAACGAIWVFAKRPLTGAAGSVTVPP